MSGLTVHRTLDLEVWANLVRKSNQRSVFVTPQFLTSLNAEYEFWICSRGDEVVGGVPVLFDSSRSPMRNPYPYTQYMGFLLVDNATHTLDHANLSNFRVVEALIETIGAHYTCIGWSQHWRLQDLRPFIWYRFREDSLPRFSIDLHYSVEIPLHKYPTFQSYVEVVRPVRRREFSRGLERLNYIASEDVHTFMSLYISTFLRQGLEVERNQQKLIERIICSALRDGSGRLGLATERNEAVSGCFFMREGTSGFYLFGGSCDRGRKLNAGTFSLLKMIETLHQEGLTSIDLVGANSPSRGDYKLSLGGELRPYFHTKLGE